MVAAAATGGDVTIKNVIPKHMETLSAKLVDMGVSVSSSDDSINVKSTSRLKPADVKTAVYPGFPTDLQQPFSVLACIADGESTVTETIYENRFRHLDELKKMGADITVKGNKAVFNGVDHLDGAQVYATDLRAGASLVVAGLAANGTTEAVSYTHLRAHET